MLSFSLLEWEVGRPRWYLKALTLWLDPRWGPPAASSPLHPRRRAWSSWRRWMSGRCCSRPPPAGSLPGSRFHSRTRRSCSSDPAGSCSSGPECAVGCWSRTNSWFTRCFCPLFVKVCVFFLFIIWFFLLRRPNSGRCARLSPPRLLLRR